MGRRWYWKLYLILMTALTVGGVGLPFYYWEESSSIDRMAEWLSLPMYIVQLVGLFGFIYWRRIGSALLCKLVFAATVLELVWVAYEMSMETGPFPGENLPFFLAMVVGGSVVLLPLVVALYVYAFRSHRLWVEAGAC
jgi:hypothetical protein